MAASVSSDLANLAQSKPYKSLDAWRGVASLWVLLFHCAETALYRSPQLRTSLWYMFCMQGYLGVQMFFVISGYCIARAASSALRRNDSIAAYLRARIRRIYPPCVAAQLGALALFAAAARMARHGYADSDVFTQGRGLHQGPLFYAANLTLTQPLLHQPLILAVSWTLCYEVAFYAIVGIALLTAARMRNPAVLWCGLHILTAAVLAVLLLAPERVPYPLDLWPQFGLGALVFDLVTHPEGRRARIALAVIAAQIVLFAALRHVAMGLAMQPSRVTFPVCLVFALTLWKAYAVDERFSANRAAQSFAALGLFSYSLYLTHTLTIHIVNQILRRGGLPPQQRLWFFCIAIIAAVCVARLFYAAFERPFLNSRRAAGRGRAGRGLAGGKQAPQDAVAGKML